MTFRKKAMFTGVLVAIFATATALAYAQHDPHAAPAAHGAAPSEHGAQTSHEGSGEHGDTAGHEGGGHHALPPINWTDIWNTKQPAVLALVINFGLLVGLYYTLGKKPVAEALKQRRVTIAKDIENAKKRLDEAKERAKKYQGDLDNVDADAQTAKAALVSAGKGEVERQLADAKEKAERMKRDADRLVEQEQKQIQQDLQRETVDRAVTEAMKILEQSVTAEDHARFANDLLAELAKRPAAKSHGGAL